MVLESCRKSTWGSSQDHNEKNFARYHSSIPNPFFSSTYLPFGSSSYHGHMNINENYTLTLEVYIFFIFNMWMKNKYMHITGPNPFSHYLKSVHPKHSVQTIPSHLTDAGGPYLRCTSGRPIF
jgi:hypothetical protein